MILGDFNVELHSTSNSLQSHCVEVIIIEWNKKKDLKDKMRKKDHMKTVFVMNKK